MKYYKKCTVFFYNKIDYILVHCTARQLINNYNNKKTKMIFFKYNKKILLNICKKASTSSSATTAKSRINSTIIKF